MTTYRAVVDGVDIFTAETGEYEGVTVFPPELIDPTEDTVTLYVDDEVIGVQTPRTTRPLED